jgi:hypothetical protein
MFTEHAFPRHSHDQFGIGIMTSGAQRSWSVIGEVESQAGDVIMVNPGEMHDGAPMGGARGWRIIYLDPALVARELANEGIGSELVIRPVARDPHLATHVVRLFKQLEAATPDQLVAEESLLYRLMSVAEKHGVDGPRATRGSFSVLKAVQRLEAAPEVATTLGELAVLSGVSRSNLSSHQKTMRSKKCGRTSTSNETKLQMIQWKPPSSASGCGRKPLSKQAPPTSMRCAWPCTIKESRRQVASRL